MRRLTRWAAVGVVVAAGAAPVALLAQSDPSASASAPSSAPVDENAPGWIRQSATDSATALAELEASLSLSTERSAALKAEIEAMKGDREKQNAALIAAGERFLCCARAVDLLARLGGDEFAILLEHVAGSDGRTELLDRLTTAMGHPFTLSGNQVQVTVSIGVATAGPGETADDLLRNADVAMYVAKRRGKGRAETYESRMYADVRERLEMEAALRSLLP
jgi:predicted signal transduction protein with EAL and GGDEF domain